MARHAADRVPDVRDLGSRGIHDLELGDHVDRVGAEWHALR